MYPRARPTLFCSSAVRSPGDVSDERALARTVLERLSQEYALRRRIHIEEVSWDDPGAPVPMDTHLTPQDAIDKRRPKPSQCDIVVVILWSRMGTPLPPEHRKPDGTPYVSGTEWEYCDAIEAVRRLGKPTVLVCRRTEELLVGVRDAKRDEKIRQSEAVETFFAGFSNPDGSLRQSYHPYRSPSEFEDLLERVLRELITRRLDELPKSESGGETTSRTDNHSPQSETPGWQGNPYLGLSARGVTALRSEKKR